jgi:hypothetical protein
VGRSKLHSGLRCPAATMHDAPRGSSTHLAGNGACRWPLLGQWSTLPGGGDLAYVCWYVGIIDTNSYAHVLYLLCSTLYLANV